MNKQQEDQSKAARNGGSGGAGLRTSAASYTAFAARLARGTLRGALICFVLAAGAGAPGHAAKSADDADQRNRQFQHAEALYLSGRLKDAATAFETLTRAYPRDGRIWLKYGNTLTKLGSYDEAATAFQNAASFDPTVGSPALNLALVRLAQAQAALDVALARFDASSPEHLQADSLQRQIKALLEPADHGTASH